MAGSLSSHLPAWCQLNNSSFILQRITSRHLLEFQSRPPIMLASRAFSMETLTRQKYGCILETEIQSLLGRCLREITSHARLHQQDFQPTEEERQIEVNYHLEATKPFHLHTTVSNVDLTYVFQLIQLGYFQLIQLGYWAVCLDLRKAYFHVLVHRPHGVSFSLSGGARCTGTLADLSARTQASGLLRG